MTVVSTYKKASIVELDEETQERFMVRFEEGYKNDELYSVWMKLKTFQTISA